MHKPLGLVNHISRASAESCPSKLSIDMLKPFVHDWCSGMIRTQRKVNKT